MTTRTASVGGGLGIAHWGAVHKDPSGKIISQQVMVQEPGPLEEGCVRIPCLWKYTAKSIRYVLTILYHQYRVEYAEKNRNKDIPEHYRTGDGTPNSIIGLILAIIKIPH